MLTLDENLQLLPPQHVDLRRIAEPVTDLFDPRVQAFIDGLMACGEANQGVGIAAPQVGAAQRIFIMASKPNPRYPDAPAMEPMALIHPQILRQSEETVLGWEGCLSVPGFRGKVPRSIEIEATWFDRFGVLHRDVFSGFLARLFQHEYDHLQGILYPDRMRPEDKLLTMEEYAAETGLNPTR